MKKKIFCVVGARPNMMKMAPLLREMGNHPDRLHAVLIHTGQHYDYAMSQVFFEQLHMPNPDYNLEVGSGSHHSQTADVIKRFGEVVAKDRPDLILVVGDVNSTMACALVGAKENIPVAHVEAGLRSFDRTMPEEINRIVTDAISDLMFITEEDARKHLLQEGVSESKIFFTGNVMIDSLIHALPAARASSLGARLGLNRRQYAILTLHRPSNVDDPKQLARTMGALEVIASKIPIVFPVHPRTRLKTQEIGVELNEANENKKIGENGIWSMPPASYVDFLGLVDSARMVITDSGGIQEETTYLGVPCLTYRENTERPATISCGTNRLVGTDPEALKRAAEQVMNEPERSTDVNRPVPPKWDGKAAERIVSVLRTELI